MWPLPGSTSKASRPRSLTPRAALLFCHTTDRLCRVGELEAAVEGCAKSGVFGEDQRRDDGREWSPPQRLVVALADVPAIGIDGLDAYVLNNTITDFVYGPHWSILLFGFGPFGDVFREGPHPRAARPPGLDRLDVELVLGPLELVLAEAALLSALDDLRLQHRSVGEDREQEFFRIGRNCLRAARGGVGLVGGDVYHPLPANHMGSQQQ